MSDLTSYANLFMSKEINSIRIPLFQRDYAQGRKDREAERIRKDFLDALFQAITEDKPISLDFIYGEVKEGVFEPFDGQQRLTTLFLLHVYFAHRVGKLAEPHPWKQFSYHTRASARMFCERLTECSPPEGEFNAEWICDQCWYLYPWEHDPTIQSMLVMINAIDEKFKHVPAEDAWCRLSNHEKPVVTFHLLPIRDLELNDQLYIRMNSRGKLLTEFEKFKAGFERTLKKSCPERVEEFAQKADGSWSELLWPYRSNDTIDDQFLRYFRFVTEVIWWRNGGEAPPAELERLAEKIYANENADENLAFLIEAFDAWRDVDIKDWFKEKFTQEGEKRTSPEAVFMRREGSNDIFRNAVDGKPLPVARILYLYAALLHRLETSPDFPRRLRILRNLVEASHRDQRDRRPPSLELPYNELRRDRMPRLLELTERIVVHGSLEDLTPFNAAQAEEERCKQQLLAERPEWASPLFKLENHPLLRGSLAAFDLQSDRFPRRAAAFYQIFPVDDNNSLPPPPFEHWSNLSAALLTIGDYSSTRDQRKFQLGSWHYQAWRDLLSGDHGRQKKDILGQLLDQINEEDPIDEQLGAIRKRWLDEQEEKKHYDWRTYFVKYPIMWAGWSNIYVGWGHCLGYRMCMLQKERLSGWYRDPYLSAIWEKLGHKGHPWFKGYEWNERWLKLQSGFELQCDDGWFNLRSPESKEHQEKFREICERYGVTNGHLPVKQHNQIDAEDRIELGARFCQQLAGL